MDATTRVAVLVGSLRKESMNRRLALAVEKLAPASWRFERLRLDDLPLFNQDNEASPPAQVTRLKGEIETADAVLFVTPEYNRSIPGVLKNAIDIASRPYGKNSFAGKPGAIIGTSMGAVGAAVAQQHLRSILGYLDVAALGQPEVYLQFKEGLIDEQGQVTSDGTRKFLQGWMDRYVAWVDRLRGRR